MRKSPPTNPTNSSELLGRIGKPRADHDALAGSIRDEPEAIAVVLGGLDAAPARMRYGCLKVLRRIAERHPTALYPLFDRIAARLDGENSILRWGALLIVGDLAAVDTAAKMEPLLARYLAPIRGPDLITAANAIVGAGKILRAKPLLVRPIVRALLRVETSEYRTPECRNVALGHVLEALSVGFDTKRAPRHVVAFARRQLANRRPAVQSKARAFLQRHETTHAGGPSGPSSRPVRRNASRVAAPRPRRPRRRS